MAAEFLQPRLARAIRAVILDVDGVLSDGGVIQGADASGTPMELKRFHITDGLGMKLLQRAGIHVAIVSGRESAATRLRASELGVSCRIGPGGRKLEHAEAVLADAGATWAELACVGDDLPDLVLMGRCVLPVAVADAVPEVLEAAAWRTSRRGGEGAVREFAEALLRARGEWDAVVEDYLAERGGTAADAPQEAGEVAS